MLEEISVAVAVQLLVPRQVFDARIAAEVRLEIAELGAELQSAPGHRARIKSRVVIGRDVPVVGHGDLGAARVRRAVVRRQETGFTLLVQRKRQVGRVEERVIQEHDARAARDADVAAFVDVELAGADEPVVVARTAGRVVRLLGAILLRALKEQPLGIASRGSVVRNAVRSVRSPGRASGGAVRARRRKREDRLVHEAAVCRQVVAQPFALDHVARGLETHVAARGELVLGRVVTHFVGGKRHPAPAQAHVAFGFGFPVGVPANLVGLDEDRQRLVALRRERQETVIRLELQAFLGLCNERQRAQQGERDALCWSYQHRGWRRGDAKIAQFIAEGNRLSSSDARLEQLREWASCQLVLRDFSLEPASEDASFRRYFRLRADGASWIVMDAPPEREDCASFVHVAELMQAAGLHVPRILAQDRSRGFLLLSDLGTQTYLTALDERNADALFSDALDALLKWQLASRPGVLPPYDEALLRRELELFRIGYMRRHLRPGRLDNQRRCSTKRSRASLPRASRSPRSTCIATTCRATSC